MRHALAILLAASAFTIGLSDREAHGEDVTCLGACRIDYGACLVSTKGDTPADRERRADCGRAYVQCALRCRAGR